MTRRAKGLGGITQRSDGLWQATWGEDGKRRYAYAWSREGAEFLLTQRLTPEKLLLFEARSKAKAERKRNVSLRRRFEIFERDGFRCRYCGASPDDGARLTIDHVLPFVAGGTDDPDNLVTACDDCNMGKKDRILPASVYPKCIPGPAEVGGIPDLISETGKTA